MKSWFALSLRDVPLLGRTSLAALAVVLLSLSLYGGAVLFRNTKEQALQVAEGGWQELLARHRQTMAEKGVLNDFLPRYQQLSETSLLRGDRLALLEQIGQGREKHRLYPVQVEIGAEFPVFTQGPGQEAGKSPWQLVASRVTLSFPLLHEEDLLRLHGEMQGGGGIFLPESWVIERREPGLSTGDPELRENLNASCAFFWLSMARGEEK